MVIQLLGVTNYCQVATLQVRQLLLWLICLTLLFFASRMGIWSFRLLFFNMSLWAWGGAWRYGWRDEYTNDYFEPSIAPLGANSSYGEQTQYS